MNNMVRHALLTTGDSYKADKLTTDMGTPGEQLMQSAGYGVTDAVSLRWPKRRVLIMCGPGNNGGDGYVAARLLQDRGWPVRVAALGDPSKLNGDAKTMYDRWQGATETLAENALAQTDLIVDALFGAGLSRPLEGVPAALASAASEAAIPCISIDMPSGVHGDTGAVLGTAFKAETTVTFCRKKPGQLLLPGRIYCGDIIVHDIGITDATVRDVKPKLHENHPARWLRSLKPYRPTDHKYDRGFVTVVSGPKSSTGAARLAARAALRAGAGLVTLLGPGSALGVLAAHETSVMTAGFDNADDLKEFLEDERRNTVVIGPGNGVDDRTKTNVLTALALDKSCVLDADALSVFEDDPKTLMSVLSERCVLTPHWGEFRRVFPDIARQASENENGFDKVQAARKAAERAGAVVLIKGADTVIAKPDGTAVINANAPPWLATAGAGDVLAGLIGAFTAQGAPAFDAACAAAWVHGAAATRLGEGLIAQDLPDAVTGIIRGLHTADGGQ